MPTKLSFCLDRLRDLQHEWGERARTKGVPDAAKDAYFEVESRLARELAALDYLVNTGTGYDPVIH